MSAMPAEIVPAGTGPVPAPPVMRLISTAERQTGTAERRISTAERRAGTAEPRTGSGRRADTAEHQPGTTERQTGVVGRSAGTVERQTSTVERQASTVERRAGAKPRRAGSRTRSAGPRPRSAGVRACSPALRAEPAVALAPAPVAPSVRHTTESPRPRLTARGRSALIAGAVIVATMLWFAVATATQAPARPASPRAAGQAPVAQIVVQPGQTLWSIAVQADPSADTRLVVQQIMSMNSLTSENVTAGQHLRVPQN